MADNWQWDSALGNDAIIERRRSESGGQLSNLAEFGAGQEEIKGVLLHGMGKPTTTKVFWSTWKANAPASRRRAVPWAARSAPATGLLCQ